MGRGTMGAAAATGGVTIPDGPDPTGPGRLIPTDPGWPPPTIGAGMGPDTVGTGAAAAGAAVDPDNVGRGIPKLVATMVPFVAAANPSASVSSRDGVWSARSTSRACSTWMCTRC